MSTILVVEDNDKNMKLVRDILVHRGHRVLEAVTGEDGVRLALAERPQLVLMDIQLPGIDGVTALARIREQVPASAMPAIAISASLMPEEQRRIGDSGFDAFIAKPISIKPFIAAVEAALARTGG